MNAYGFTPHYVLSTDRSDPPHALPIFEIRSILTGRRGVSLPFSDYCDPLVPDHRALLYMLEWVYSYGKKNGWAYVELRTRKELPEGLTPSETFFLHDLVLQPGPEKMLKTFRDSTARNIRKAQKEGVEVRVDASIGGMKEFYRLNCMTRKEHGLPPQPYRFFELLHEHLISKDCGFLVLAGKPGTVMEGNLFLHFGDRVYYKFGASDRTFQDLRASNLAMWEGIQRAAKSGFRTLCFGKTETFHDGLRQFKNGWGTRETRIQYVKYDLGKGEYVINPSRVNGFHNGFFRAMPTPVSRAIGSVLYRHMA